MTEFEVVPTTGIVSYFVSVPFRYGENTINSYRERAAKRDFEQQFQAYLMASISDGREYIVKVLPMVESNEIYNYEPAIRYYKAAFVGLRNWQDAELYEFVRPSTEPYGEVFVMPVQRELDYRAMNLTAISEAFKTKRFERCKFMHDGHGYLLWQRKE